MRHDLINNLALHEHFTGSYTSAQTPSNGVDVAGLIDPTAIVYVGTMSNSGGSPAETWEFALEHSDSPGSGFAAVADTDVVYRSGRADSLSSGVFATVGDDVDSGSAADDDAMYAVTYVGQKRYIRVTATPSNTPGSTPITAMVVGTPADRPASDAAV